MNYLMNIMNSKVVFSWTRVEDIFENFNCNQGYFCNFERLQGHFCKIPNLQSGNADSALLDILCKRGGFLRMEILGFSVEI